ncbi:MAG: hypothetical protein AAF720_05930 [Pseudomonadota bacterium]
MNTDTTKTVKSKPAKSPPATKDKDITDQNPTKPLNNAQSDGRSRVRFQGVVEKDGDAIPQGAYFHRASAPSPIEDGVEVVKPTDWKRLSRQLAEITRISALLLFGATLIFWPVLTAVGHWRVVGSLRGWNLVAAYPAWAFIFIIIGPVLLWALGQIVSRQMLMMGAAEKIALSAQQLTEPDRNAVFNVESVGAAVRTQISAVNAGIDDSLIRLASVEAMIRQHVEAIEEAGTAIETRATGSLDLVASERAKLMKLTEQLNAQADDFAVAIAEKAQANIDSFNSVNELTGEAETKLEERLQRLEAIADHALTSFEALASALQSSEGKLSDAAASVRASSDDVKSASEQASKIAEEAATAAARNAVNVGQFSKRAAEEATKASNEAITIARSEAEKTATAAIDAAKEQSGRIADAVVAAVEAMKEGADETAEAAMREVERTVKASETLTGAAEKVAAAASAAGSAVESAGTQAQEALKQTAAELSAQADKENERTAIHLKERNKELSAVRSALEKENERLEDLIQEQRERADRLASAIATQTERLTQLADSPVLSNPVIDKETANTKLRIADEPKPGRSQQTDDSEAEETSNKSSKERPALQEHSVNGDNLPGDHTDTTVISDQKAITPPDSADTPLDLVNPTGKSDIKRQKRDIQDNGTKKKKPSGTSKEQRAKEKDSVSWKEILSATDDGERLDLNPNMRTDRNRRPGAKAMSGSAQGSDGSADAIEVVHRLQNFTLNLDRRLYGDASEQLLERFDSGDRNLFAHRLLRLNETDVKRRIRSESTRDPAFEKAIHEFLHGFESLLEEATTSDTADEDLEEYLGSPLGKVYLLIGATVGYFS